MGQGACRIVAESIAAAGLEACRLLLPMLLYATACVMSWLSRIFLRCDEADAECCS